MNLPDTYLLAKTDEELLALLESDPDADRLIAVIEAALLGLRRIAGRSAVLPKSWRDL